jgi:hypothetical protein
MLAAVVINKVSVIFRCKIAFRLSDLTLLIMGDTVARVPLMEASGNSRNGGADGRTKPVRAEQPAGGSPHGCILNIPN